MQRPHATISSAWANHLDTNGAWVNLDNADLESLTAAPAAPPEPSTASNACASSEDQSSHAPSLRSPSIGSRPGPGSQSDVSEVSFGFTLSLDETLGPAAVDNVSAPYQRMRPVQEHMVRASLLFPFFTCCAAPFLHVLWPRADVTARFLRARQDCWNEFLTGEKCDFCAGRRLGPCAYAPDAPPLCVPLSPEL